MHNIKALVIFILAITVATLQHAEAQSFNDVFRDSTLRIDYSYAPMVRQASTYERTTG